jgi:hypothetical protein
LRDKKKKPIRCETIINSITYLVSTCFIITYPPHFTEEAFYLNQILIGLWKYYVLTVAAYLLNVSLVLHQENVPIAGGRNVVAGRSCPITSEMSSIQCRSRSHISKNGPGGGVEPTTLVHFLF